ncbi:MAG: TIGR02281 family clan AA aspartic protease [Gammaproteobacteria bacterium]|nr:TIGR02281 family clan AA aspartic protease [Gammaproteobacteria bacterium]
MSSTEKDFGHKLGRAMIYAAWSAVAVLLTWGFSEYLDRVRNPNQTVESRSAADGIVEVVLKRNRFGHYVATGSINGEPVEFLVDTGATTVSLPADLADRLHLARGVALPTQTAAGVIRTYATTLNTVQLGPILLTDVPASINPRAQGDAVLLGMAFLKGLEFEQRGDELLIRQPTAPR